MKIIDAEIKDDKEQVITQVAKGIGSMVVACLLSSEPGNDDKKLHLCQQYLTVLESKHPKVL